MEFVKGMTIQKKLLYICHRIPYPPNKGDKIRSYNFLKYLSTRYDVYLAFLVDNKKDLKYVDDVRNYVKETAWEPINAKYKKIASLKSLVSGRPMSVEYFFSPKLQHQIHGWLSEHNFDSILLFSSCMAEYVMSVNNTPRIMDFCDVDSDKWRQYARFVPRPFCWLYRFEGRRLMQYEQQIASRFDYCLLVSQEEAKLFRKIAPDIAPIVVGNGIDLELYNGGANGFYDGDIRPTRPYVVFTGVMDYRPNVDAVSWFVEDIFPGVREKLPNLDFFIVGANPTRRVRKLGNKKKGVCVTGYVKDVRPYIKGAELFVAPMRIARGMQTKMLEAMACGVPVVTSPAGAQGIGARAGREVLVAETAPEYVRQMLDLLSNKAQREHLRRQAFSFLRENFSWAQKLGLLDRLLERNHSISQTDLQNKVLINIARDKNDGTS